MLSEEQKLSFNRDGFLVVPDVFDQTTVLYPVRNEYLNLLDNLMETWVSDGQLPAQPTGLTFAEKLISSYRVNCDWFRPFDISLPGGQIKPDTPLHLGEAVFNMITSASLLDIVEDIIGPEITSVPIQHIRIKPPDKVLRPSEARSYITSTDWHQDRGVVLEEADRTEMLTAWIAVTDATVDNGCLQVVPGAHCKGLMPHCPRTQSRRQLGIADGHFEKDRAIPVPVRSGGVVILHPLIPHSSMINRTEDIRWSFDLRFCVTGQPTGRAQFPAFVARSRAHPGNVLNSAAVWRANWENARTRLASQRHIGIHRWSPCA